MHNAGVRIATHVRLPGSGRGLHRQAMRVWIDVTNSPHVVFFRPLVALLTGRGHDVTITARDFAQTVELLQDARGRAHRGRASPRRRFTPGKVRAMGSALRALRAFASPRDFDVALRTPRTSSRSSRARWGSRRRTRSTTSSRWLSTRSAAAPRHGHRAGGDPPGAARQARRPCPEGTQVPGPQGGVLPPRVLSRPHGDRAARDRSLAHPRGRADAARGLALPPPRNPLFADVLERIGTRPGRPRRSSCPEQSPSSEQRCAGRGLESLIVPERAVDALSLVARADLVVSAGGR